MARIYGETFLAGAVHGDSNHLSTGAGARVAVAAIQVLAVPAQLGACYNPSYRRAVPPYGSSEVIVDHYVVTSTAGSGCLGGGDQIARSDATLGAHAQGGNG